jgi:hypothetical protein
VAEATVKAEAAKAAEAAKPPVSEPKAAQEGEKKE